MIHIKLMGIYHTIKVVTPILILTAPGAPSSFEYNSVDNNNKNLTWEAPTSSGTGGITAYKIQVDNNSDFSSPIFDFDEYSSTTLNVVLYQQELIMQELEQLTKV